MPTNPDPTPGPGPEGLLLELRELMHELNCQFAEIKEALLGQGEQAGTKKAKPTKKPKTAKKSTKKKPRK